MTINQIIEQILEGVNKGQSKHSYELLPLEATYIVNKLKEKGIESKWKKNDMILNYHGVTIYTNK